MPIDYRTKFEKEKEVKLQIIARHNFTQTAIDYFEWLEKTLAKSDEQKEIYLEALKEVREIGRRISIPESPRSDRNNMRKLAHEALKKGGAVK